jgi:hypothetical protein
VVKAVPEGFIVTALVDPVERLPKSEAPVPPDVIGKTFVEDNASCLFDTIVLKSYTALGEIAMPLEAALPLI